MARYTMTGTLTVALPRDRAFRLFTAYGERDWARGWEPRFPQEPADDSDPGTVFETEAHGDATIWVVTECVPGRLIRYARVTPGVRAGTVTVELADVGAETAVTVTYDLTALTPDAVAALRDFADGYPAFLRSWQDAIAAIT